jgi:4-hydroxy-tetrahydrodipicolinate synthase
MNNDSANLKTIRGAIQYGRKVKGIAAALLPYTEQGSIDYVSYERVLRNIKQSGLTCAVNMDTGYVNLLTTQEKREVLRFAADVLTGTPFVAGAFVEGLEGDLARLYHSELEQIVAAGGTPILFQSARMHGLNAENKAALYREIAKAASEVLAFELGSMFAPNGEIWDSETFQRILEIPQIVGAKHSSLNRLTEIDRLEVCARLRPEFSIYTGNDLGIDMVEFGSDYLLGLAAFCPDKFAERDRAWEAGDAGYLELSDALQHLGCCAFRPPVPAYKHSAASFLHLTGVINSATPHPACVRRNAWESELMLSCAQRLGYLA